MMLDSSDLGFSVVTVCVRMSGICTVHCFSSDGERERERGGGGGEGRDTNEFYLFLTGTIH